MSKFSRLCKVLIREQPYCDDLGDNRDGGACDRVELFEWPMSIVESTRLVGSSNLSADPTCYLRDFQDLEDLIEAIQYGDLGCKSSAGLRTKNTSDVRQL